jgi:hypothetical protein
MEQERIEEERQRKLRIEEERKKRLQEVVSMSLAEQRHQEERRQSIAQYPVTPKVQEEPAVQQPVETAQASSQQVEPQVVQVHGKVTFLILLEN